TRWSYDAKTLEGLALVSMAEKKSDSGDYKGAIQQYELAGEAYRQAAELGRSKAEIYQNDCARWGKIMTAQNYSGMDPTTSLPKAEEACNNAILINPDAPAGYLRKAYMYSRVGSYQVYNTSDDPRIMLKKAMEMAHEGEKRDPKGWEAHHLFSAANVTGGEYELRHGIDPQNTLQEAISQGNQALKFSENNPEVLFSMGTAYELLGEYQDQNGKNPIPTYEKAIQQFQQIDKTNSTVNTGDEAAISYNFIAMYRMNHGQDPTDSFRLAIEK